MADIDEKQVTGLPLDKLLLDKDNPRFGFQVGSASQAEVLDRIVEKFGVEDVLSSLAVNGYFAAEPLVCRQMEDGDRVIVAEGNRRLAACLILIEDKRATNQIIRTKQYRPIWEKHGQKKIDPLPVILFEPHEQEQEILSYLGVRHIASAQPWDSYAKAAWVARIVEQDGISVADVATMIGDQHRTVLRLLEGYYFVNQLIDEGYFRPEDSIRRGRGSVTEYPFSWIYTILGYTTVRRFLGLSEDEGPRPVPIPAERLAKAKVLTQAMFGDRSKGQAAAINDSRQIGDLAKVVADDEKLRLLEQGKSLDEIQRVTQPLDESLTLGLGEVRDIQSDLVTRIVEYGLEQPVAERFVSPATRNRKLSTQLERLIQESAHGELDED